LVGQTSDASSWFPVSPFSDGAAGTTSASFLKLPSGPRSEALGGAAAALAEGAEALFWNPAGLARLPEQGKSEVTAGYSALLETSYLSSLAYALPTSIGVFASGLSYFSQGAQTQYDAVGNAVGKFSPYDLGFSLGYARRLSRILIGGAVKMVRSSIAEASATTAAVDFGIQAPHVGDVGDGPLDVGVSFSNLGPPLKLGAVPAPLPFSMRGGMFWHLSSFVGAAADIVLPVDEAPYAALGLEATLKQNQYAAALRLGYDQSHSRGVDGLAGLTAGAGLDAGFLRIDYAWVPFGDLGMTNRIAATFRF
jgi:hypothetical protein